MVPQRKAGHFQLSITLECLDHHATHQQQIRERDFLRLHQTAAFEKELSLTQSSALDMELLNVFRQHLQARHHEIPMLRALESTQTSKMGHG